MQKLTKFWVNFSLKMPKMRGWAKIEVKFGLIKKKKKKNMGFSKLVDQSAKKVSDSYAHPNYPVTSSFFAISFSATFFLQILTLSSIFYAFALSQRDENFSECSQSICAHFHQFLAPPPQRLARN